MYQNKFLHIYRRAFLSLSFVLLWAIPAKANACPSAGSNTITFNPSDNYSSFTVDNQGYLTQLCINNTLVLGKVTGVNPVFMYSPAPPAVQAPVAFSNVTHEPNSNTLDLTTASGDVYYLNYSQGPSSITFTVSGINATIVPHPSIYVRLPMYSSDDYSLLCNGFVCTNGFSYADFSALAICATANCSNYSTANANGSTPAVGFILNDDYTEGLPLVGQIATTITRAVPAAAGTLVLSSHTTRDPLIWDDIDAAFYSTFHIVNPPRSYDPTLFVLGVNQDDPQRVAAAGFERVLFVDGYWQNSRGLWDSKPGFGSLTKQAPANVAKYHDRSIKVGVHFLVDALSTNNLLYTGTPTADTSCLDDMQSYGVNWMVDVNCNAMVGTGYPVYQGLYLLNHSPELLQEVTSNMATNIKNSEYDFAYLDGAEWYTLAREPYGSEPTPYAGAQAPLMVKALMALSQQLNFMDLQASSTAPLQFPWIFKTAVTDIQYIQYSFSVHSWMNSILDNLLSSKRQLITPTFGWIPFEPVQPAASPKANPRSVDEQNDYLLDYAYVLDTSIALGMPVTIESPILTPDTNNPLNFPQLFHDRFSLQNQYFNTDSTIEKKTGLYILNRFKNGNAGLVLFDNIAPGAIQNDITARISEVLPVANNAVSFLPDLCENNPQPWGPAGSDAYICGPSGGQCSYFNGCQLIPSPATVKQASPGSLFTIPHADSFPDPFTISLSFRLLQPPQTSAQVALMLKANEMGVFIQNSSSGYIIVGYLYPGYQAVSFPLSGTSVLSWHTVAVSVNRSSATPSLCMELDGVSKCIYASSIAQSRTTNAAINLGSINGLAFHGFMKNIQISDANNSLVQQWPLYSASDNSASQITVNVGNAPKTLISRPSDFNGTVILKDGDATLQSINFSPYSDYAQSYYVLDSTSCVGSWGACSNGAQTYTITTQAGNGGTACPFTNGTTQSCGTNCVGSWGTCINGTQTYIITTPAASGGAQCPFAGGAAQSCVANGPQSYNIFSNDLQIYSAPSQAETSVVNCLSPDGITQSCVTDCVGSWGTCIDGTQTYTITTQAGNGGADCPNADGDTQSCDS